MDRSVLRILDAARADRGISPPTVAADPADLVALHAATRRAADALAEASRAAQRAYDTFAAAGLTVANQRQLDRFARAVDRLADAKRDCAVILIAFEGDAWAARCTAGGPKPA